MVNYSEEEVDRLSIVDKTAKKKKRLFARLKLPFIIAAIVIFLGGGSGWWFLIRPGATEQTVETEGSDSLIIAEVPETEHEPPPFGEIFTIDDLVVNPAGGRRIFMVSLGVEYFDSEQLAEMQRREPILRDNLITFFSSQPSDYLSNIKYRQALRSRVKKIMDYQLGEGVVSRIIFQKWIFQ
ncbi:MAG: flagellar basal body-associated FliL family protein [Calditrichaeota bacterium]|nr:flagellar basal body-associated FliL family protein [Calditrichota bacterium]